MFNRSLNSVLTRFGIIAAVLATLLLLAPAASAQSASECAVDGKTLKCTYDENGMDPVARFQVSDEDTDTEGITWSLKEVDDYKSFAIDASGELSFKKSPDFEKKSSYKVTVTTSAGGEQAVEVKINNIEEDGEVTFEGNPQPQVGGSLRALLKDGDGGEFNKEWQWSRSEDKEAWTAIDTARASLYTVSSDDVGNYLQATVTYRDALGDDKQTAMGETIYKARVRPSANRAPEFPDQNLETPGVQNDEIVREVPENSAKGASVGEPVVAFDKDSDEVVHSVGDADADLTDNAFNALTTTITNAAGEPYISVAGDGDVFKIDPTTGQITVEDKDALDLESTTNTDDAFVVTVSATDPSGAVGSITVVIKVTDKNEAPVIGDQTDTDGNPANGIDDGDAETNPTSIMVPEEGTDAVVVGGTGVTFLAADPDIDGPNNTDAVGWSTAGPDGKFFTISTTGTGRGALSFDTASPKKPLSFEAMGSADGDNVYEVDIVAASGDAKSTHRLKVEITNMEETGEIPYLSQRRPVTGIPIVALNHSDKDGGVKDRFWTWYRGAAGLPDTTLVTAGTTGRGADSTLETGLVKCDVPAATPDTAPCQVSEGSASYTPVDADEDYRLYVVVRYTDGNDDDDSLTLNVDENEEYVVAASEQESDENPAANSTPAFNDQDTETPGTQNEATTREVDEDAKGADVGSAVLANDGSDLLLYTLGGPDKDKFKVGRTSGQITTAEKLDYESLSEDAKYHMVTVVATDPYGATTSISVTINVNDVDESATITPAASAQSASECAVDGKTLKCTYDENGMDPVARFQVSDEDTDTEGITWSLKEVDDYKSFAIDASGELSFKKSPDFEKKSSYKVTVTTSAGGEQAVEVKINNIEEDGEVTFEGNPQPQVGGSLRALLKDGDGGEFNKEWQWSRSEDKEAWTAIDTARASLYTVSSDDVGNYLQATVTYRDALGDDKQTAMGETIYKARVRPSANRAPEFPDQNLETPGVQNDEIVREVPENSAKGASVGEPVVAFDKDSDEVVHSVGDADADLTDNAFNALTTTITNAAGEPYISVAGDGDVFKIDPTTGQITVEDKDALDLESTTNTDDAFVVTVSATDPSGAVGSITVVIKVTDKNEAPVIGDQTDTDGNPANGIDDGDAETNPTSIMVPEEGTDAVVVGGTGVTFLAADPDIDGPNNTDAVGWSTAGPDGKFFTISTTGTGRGALSFDTASPKKPLSFEAMGSADGDNVYEVDIVAASGDAKSTHRLKVEITNMEETGEIPYLSQRRPVTGIPIVALNHSDKDGGVKDRSWTWYRGAAGLPDTTLVTAGTTGRGADSTLETGLVKCDVPAATPDTAPCQVSEGSASYTPVDADEDYRLYVVVRYTDGNDDDDSLTLNVDENEEYVVAASEQESDENPAANSTPAFNDQDTETPGTQNEATTREVDEDAKGADVGSAVLANDGDDLLLYTLGGPDKDKFKVGRTSGQITTAEKLDYESLPEDAKYHMVTVVATDPYGATTSISVTINVNDVDESATITLTVRPAVNTAPAFPGATAARNVDENMYAGTDVGEPVTATDDDSGDTVTYTISESMYFGIDENSGQITTTMTLDEEDMSSHMVTVTATDSEGETDSVNVAITVNDSQPGCDTVGDMGLVNDCEALLDSEDALGGSLNWGDDTPMSDWDGVTMSGGRVTAVNLRDQGLDGMISAALGRLSELTSLNLRSNEDLSGEIPGSLNDLSDLTVLNLHSNSHTGEIPDLSGTSLVELYLPGNELTGSVPAWLNTMTDMTELWLWGNDLSGMMPDLNDMTSLDKLKLNGNTGLTGIDAAMLPGGLRWLIIGQTDIGANAPDLSGMMSLTTLWMNETGLSGVIPVAGIPTSLTSLNLKDNMLSGTIPDMSGLDNLVLLRLHRNQLSGDIPGTLGDLESIERIWAYDNDLTGIAAGFANADDTLTHLELRGNSFTADTCLPGDLADVANNDFELAGLAACQ